MKYDILPSGLNCQARISGSCHVQDCLASLVFLLGRGESRMLLQVLPVHLFFLSLSLARSALPLVLGFGKGCC